MASLNGFNASQVEAKMGFDPLPNGVYRMIITDSEQKENKSQTGHFLKLNLQVIEGEYKGRTIFSILNLDNPNEQAVKIALGELSCICHAVGVLQPKDSSELHNIPMDVEVVVKRKSKDDPELTNSIKGYKKVGTTPVTSTNSKNPFAK